MIEDHLMNRVETICAMSDLEQHLNDLKIEETETQKKVAELEEVSKKLRQQQERELLGTPQQPEYFSWFFCAESCAFEEEDPA